MAGDRNNILKKRKRRSSKKPVDIYILDGNCVDGGIVASLSWAAMINADCRFTAGSAFASFTGLYCPELQNLMISGLKEAGASPSTIMLPSEESKALGLVTDERHKYKHEENLVYFVVILMLLFKQVSVHNFDGFVRARLKAAAGRLGFPYFEVDKMRFPLSLRNVLFVKEMYSGNRKIKQKIMKFLLWAREQDTIFQTLASYACIILEWNELNTIRFIKDTLVVSGSPVLKHISIQDEVKNYEAAMKAINRSPYPKYFKYFCSTSEERLVLRRNFRILGAVAQKLMADRSENLSIENFAGTTESEGALVDSLVEIHKKFEKTHKMSVRSSDALRFIFGDEDCDEMIEDKEKASEGEEA